jgi:hypothetical protein
MYLYASYILLILHTNNNNKKHIYMQRSWHDLLDTTLCDKVCQWLATGRWFSLGTLVSSTNKSYCHDITEILLNVALNTITLTRKCCTGTYQLVLIDQYDRDRPYNNPFGNTSPIYVHIYEKTRWNVTNLQIKRLNNWSRKTSFITDSATKCSNYIFGSVTLYWYKLPL